MKLLPRRFWSPSSTYHKLHLSEEKPSTADVRYGRKPPGRLAWGNIVTHVLVVVLVVSLSTVSTLYLQLLRQREPPQLLTCGHSIRVAKEAGCSFDRLTKTWLPPACPRYYEDDFVQYPSKHNMTDWKYWTDAEATEEITDQDMAAFAERTSRDETVWVSSMRMHLVHCAFGLRRRSRALDGGERLDLATAPLDHTHHCIDMLLEAAMLAPGIDEPIAEGHVIFGAC